MDEITLILPDLITPDVYRVTDLAKTFKVSRQTINAWVKAGRFPNKIGGDGVTLIPYSDVKAVFDEETEKAVSRLIELGYELANTPESQAV